MPKPDPLDTPCVILSKTPLQPWRVVWEGNRLTDAYYVLPDRYPKPTEPYTALAAKINDQLNILRVLLPRPRRRGRHTIEYVLPDEQGLLEVASAALDLPHPVPRS